MSVIFTLNDKELGINMTVTNVGIEPMKFTCLLHTYFKVGDVRNTTVKGF